MQYLLAALLWACSLAYAQSSLGAFQSTNSSPPVGFVPCAAEGQKCVFSGRAWVTFGSPQNWTPPKVLNDGSGGAECAVWFFGDPNAAGPVATLPRSCYYMPLSARFPDMLPLPSGLALLNEPLTPPSALPKACQTVELGGTGAIGLRGSLPSGKAEAWWCRSADGWIGFFHVVDAAFQGTPLIVQWPGVIAPAPSVWTVAATPGYAMTFAVSVTGAVTWIRSKVVTSTAPLGGMCDCGAVQSIEGPDRYCRFTAFTNDVALCRMKP